MAEKWQREVEEIVERGFARPPRVPAHWQLLRSLLSQPPWLYLLLMLLSSAAAYLTSGLNGGLTVLLALLSLVCLLWLLLGPRLRRQASFSNDPKGPSGQRWRGRDL